MLLNKILQGDYTVSSLYHQIKLPLDIEISIPSDDPVRLVSAFVEEMNLSDLYETYDRIRKNQATPRQMLKIVIYAAMNRIRRDFFSAAKPGSCKYIGKISVHCHVVSRTQLICTGKHSFVFKLALSDRLICQFLVETLPDTLFHQWRKHRPINPNIFHALLIPPIAMDLRFTQAAIHEITCTTSPISWQARDANGLLV